MASPEQQNLPLSVEAIEAGRNFANKTWNAARLVLSFEGKPALPAEDTLSPTERWLLGRHQACVREVNDALDRDEFAEAAQALYRFVWSEFCDWGLEMQKDRLYDGAPSQRRVAADVLAWILERTLRLMHPVMPFVTEEIWQRFGKGESIVIAEWPDAETHASHEQLGAESQKVFPFFEDLVTAVRRFRGDHGISPKTKMPLRIVVRKPMLKDMIDIFGPELLRLAAVEEVTFVDGSDRVGCLALLVQGETILVPVGDLIDVEKELASSAQRLAKAQSDVEKARKKLDNPTFREKAASDVVLAQELKLGVGEREIASLEQEIAELTRLAGS
jgi:valyl-tRNA synthetase